MLRYLLAIGSLMTTAAATAEPVELRGDEIRAVVGGALFEVDAPMGYKLPIRFSEDGRMTGEAGNLAYALGAPSDKGKWWISSDRLCHKWNKWLDATVNCLRLSQRGARIFWRRDDGEAGTATIISPGRAMASALQSEPPPTPEASAPKPAPPEPSVPPKPSSFSVIASATAMPASELPRVVQRPTPAPPRVIAKRAASKRPATHEPPVTSGYRVKVPEAQHAQVPPAKAHAAHPRSAPTAPSFRVSKVAPDDVLNVREGPSTDYMVIGTLLPDANGVRVVGPCQFDWCPISHRGITGWVNSFYLSEDTHVGQGHRDSFQPRVGSTQYRR